MGENAQNWTQRVVSCALSTGRPLLPYVQEYHVRYNRHLNGQYIPDAHGLQVLTDAHLARVDDLSGWIIEPLGAGKHLVQAKDLEPWYATIDPDPDTLAKARTDFGGMLLTPRLSQPTRHPGGTSSHSRDAPGTPNSCLKCPTAMAVAGKCIWPGLSHRRLLLVRSRAWSRRGVCSRGSTSPALLSRALRPVSGFVGRWFGRGGRNRCQFR
jgi:hypothetical protein